MMKIRLINIKVIGYFNFRKLNVNNTLVKILFICFIMKVFLDNVINVNDVRFCFVTTYICIEYILYVYILSIHDVICHPFYPFILKVNMVNI